ncbi:MAG: sigma-E processing peptidase SpoIIGA [Eubacteriales bacterium]|nr:sigma-E processing peptidase SpoIIGA [Eubacteriales bacterium]
MYEKVYIDVVFAVNLLMDYLLLQAAGRIFHCKRSSLRILAASAAGALFSCLILYVPGGTFFWTVIALHGACAAGMVVLGLGLKKGSLLGKAVMTLYLAAFFAGGVWEAALGGRLLSPACCLLTTVCMYLGLTALFCFWESFWAGRRNLYPVTLSYGGRVQSSYGLYDTGNLLADPVNGAPVSIVEPMLLEKLLTKALVEKLKHLKENPGELESTELAGLHPRFLPYQTMEGRGILLAVTLEDLMIHTPGEVVHIDRPVFALAVEPSALGKEYKVLLNSSLLH